MKKPTTHGGRREGAGRPTADQAENLVQLTVYVEQADVDKAEKLGGGNKSLGVRRALKQAKNWIE